MMHDAPAAPPAGSTPALQTPIDLENAAEKKILDAGMRPVDHYVARLSRWRYAFRQALIPVVRYETPYLARLQARFRTPTLDSYFAFTANLGTHTFFMVMLPVLFWCGYTRLGRAMVHLLALGVIISGIIKDLLCLPRPLSPPLQRITMSGSAALEYGFPSTHSTNAISVVVYALYELRTTNELSWGVSTGLQALCWTYGTSIVFGRLYCGMHGFLDVVVGSALGALIAVVQILAGDAFDTWIHDGPILNILLLLTVILAVVRTHPEPADDCPCFDDSVCFAGVLIGVSLAFRHYANGPYSLPHPYPGTTPYSFASLGWPTTLARVALGVLLIFAWRATAKSLLLRTLPPLFRVIELGGADLPRRFFLKASQYDSVPKLRHDDNVLPSAAEVAQLVGDVRRRRGRAVSVGPQSVADAYEALAYRQEQRRKSLSAEPESPRGPTEGLGENEEERERAERREIFRGVEKPRVRYDVEVVTKLIVYAGIGWLAVEVSPVVFELSGLGLGSLHL
ncbi:PAP2-domain-containing protein [Trichodelitschia bisporula]|uniref:PAP2-domain-containing protein n=1 Tax=Trichodelitschia bisporula TaxID=703511 RepID=A0A6G1HKT1_9PEZI|nr:PAP2-domain-containing protein [Trichodelitschia bisporula]